MKDIGKIFLGSFGLYWFWLLWGWVKLFGVDAWEMGDSAFLIIWSAITIWTLIMSIWTYRLFKNGTDDLLTKIQYGLILVIGLFPLAAFFYISYN